MTDRKTALVIGATGVIGRTLVRHLDTLHDWSTIAVSRRPPGYETRARHLAADLDDAADCRAKFADLPDVTHVVYAAYTDRPSWAEQCAPNAAMLANAMDGIEAGAPNLRHVTLMQGTKYYGAHLGPFKTPAREDDPRHFPPNFYFDQQDLLAARQRGKPWSWTLLRPHTVVGFALGMPLNLLNVLAVFAAISKELGLPLRWPGKAAAFRTIFQATDAELLARATVWAGTAPACANQAFNITNGDFFRWEQVWPGIAAAFDMETGPVQTLDLPVFMADKAPLWDAMVSRHGLRPHAFAEVAHWPFGNYVLGNEWDIMSSTTKARLAGFHDCLDSEAAFSGHFARLRRERFVP